MHIPIPTHAYLHIWKFVSLMSSTTAVVEEGPLHSPPHSRVLNSLAHPTSTQMVFHLDFSPNCFT